MRKIILISILLLLTGCSVTNDYSIKDLLIDPLVFNVEIERQPDGIYRGSFYDSGIEQVGIQFKVIDNYFKEVTFTSLSYKNGNYLSDHATDSQKAILKQYQQMADYLVNKPIDAINDLYDPVEIVDDIDAVTASTIRSNKLISAIHDGFNRRPYEILDTTVMDDQQKYVDGIYRGFFYKDGQEQIAIEFELHDNNFIDFTYRGLRYASIDYLQDKLNEYDSLSYKRYNEIKDFLIGKNVSEIYALYTPDKLFDDTDAITTATFKSNGLISAIGDALNRNPYILTSTTVFENDKDFLDGTYRGFYYDNGIEQVNVHFVLKNNCFESITFRGLAYGGIDYLAQNLDDKSMEVQQDYFKLAAYLIGKDINSINALYQINNIDAMTHSTIKTNKLISALWNGINRNVYK